MKTHLSKLFASVFLAVLFCLSIGWAIAQDTTVDNTEAELPEVVAALDAAKDPETTAKEMAIILVALTAPELSDVADVWQQHLRKLLEQTMRINIEIERSGLEVTGTRDELAALTVQTRGMLDVYADVLAAWKRKGGVEEDIKPHEDYLIAVRGELLRNIDIATLVGLAVSWLASWDGGLKLILEICGLILAIWAMAFVARFATRSTKRGLDKLDAVSKLLSDFIQRTVYWVTFAVGIVIVLGSFGVNITPAFAVFGGVSFILGFALQETLGNLASGLMLMVHKPFDTGDHVLIAGCTGTVDHMSVVSTKIRTLDNQIISVPNSKIWGDVITNFTASPIRRIDLVFGIGYSDDTELAIKVLKDILSEHPKCLDHPKAEVFVGQLGDSSVNIFCRPWVKPEDYLKVSWDLTGKAKERFDKAGISIPFPQRDVHLFQERPLDDPASS